MRITKGYLSFKTINIDGEEYIKLKDVNILISACYQEKIRNSMDYALEKFKEFVIALQSDEFDIEKEIKKGD